eukprot:Gb_36694 [translate_table: standard]
MQTSSTNSAHTRYLFRLAQDSPSLQVPAASNCSIQWHYRRAITSPKPRQNRARRIKSIVSAIIQPLTSSSESSHIADKITNGVTEGDENKFNWLSQWYPIAPEYDLDKRVPHAFTVVGFDIVVWWDKNGQNWLVFDDRCPHRLAPLSEGRIDEDGDLQCSYHGWCFGASGECKYIPQAPFDGPPVHTSKRACARVYPSIQQQGIIWFWPNTDPQFRDIVLKEKPSFIPVLSDPSFPCTLSMRDVPYGYEILTENLLDPSHVPYAHHGLQGQTDMTSRSGSLKNDRRGGRPLDLCLQKMEKSGFEGKGEKGSINFIAPTVITMEYTFTPLKKEKTWTLRAHAEQEKKRTVFLVFFCIPVSPGRSRLIWAFPRNFALWADLLFPRWLVHIQQNLFIDSDLYILHLEEHRLQENDQIIWEKACYVPTTSDVFVVAFRKWLKQYAGGAPSWGKKFSGSLPPSPPKEQLMDRYWSHVVKCHSCKGALKVFRALEIVMQLASISCVAILGVVATARQATSSSIHLWTTPLVCTTIICCLVSRWLSHFIYKTYYFHDYNHALIK